MTENSQNFNPNPYFSNSLPPSHFSKNLNTAITYKTKKSHDNSYSSYSSNLPYPEIKVSQKNLLYAREMLSNMGGQYSELTALLSYFYSHLILEKYFDIAKAFHFISISEMKHLEIFGQLSVKLGADPRLWEFKRRGVQYWNAGYINYNNQNPKSAIQNAVNMELETIEKYKHQIRNINDIHIKEILKRIIEDEKIHIEILRKFLLEVK